MGCRANGTSASCGDRGTGISGKGRRQYAGQTVHCGAVGLRDTRTQDADGILQLLPQYKYRLVARIRYDYQLVNVRAILTHREYDEGQWKE